MFSNTGKHISAEPSLTNFLKRNHCESSYPLDKNQRILIYINSLYCSVTGDDITTCSVVCYSNLTNSLKKEITVRAHRMIKNLLPSNLPLKVAILISQTYTRKMCGPQRIRDQEPRTEFLGSILWYISTIPKGDNFVHPKTDNVWGIPQSNTQTI